MTDDEADQKRRISITKLQRQTAAGAELISLCQTITEDGSLSEAEITDLRQWLHDNRAADLPALGVLLKTVETIIADGRVTADERRELYHAIEIVLPPDVRSVARDRRRTAESAERARVAVAREAAKHEQREARTRSQPLESWDFMVAGVRYEGRPDVISKHANAGDVAFLARDRANPHSPHAVEVRLGNGMQIGHVPEEDAVDVAPYLGAGHPHSACIKKILTGGRVPIPVVIASVFHREAGGGNLVRENQVPAKVAPAKASRAGCGFAAVMAVALLVAALAVQLSC